MTTIAKLILTNCIGCGLCVEKCPTNAIPESLIGYISGLAEIDEIKCTGCGDCVQFCEHEAIILDTSGDTIKKVDYTIE